MSTTSSGHPLADWQRLKLWPKCWQLPRSDRERYILWDQLRRLDGHEAAFSWVELDEVAEFLPPGTSATAN